MRLPEVRPLFFYFYEIWFQSYIYNLAGYSLLSELCAQMVLSVNIVDMIIDEMEMFENRAQAVEIIYKGVRRWSDKLSQNKVILYLQPLRPIFFTLEKSRQIFLKIKRRGPPVRDMRRHKLEVIK